MNLFPSTLLYFPRLFMPKNMLMTLPPVMTALSTRSPIAAKGKLRD